MTIPALFITGTEKNPDKTYITAGLALTLQSLGYSVGVYKPVATGAVIRDGIPAAKETLLLNSLDPYVKTYTTYTFEEDRDPLLAAFASNTSIIPLEILGDYQKMNALHEIILIEGTDGPLSPIAESFTEESLIKWLNVPVLFVVSGANPAVNNAVKMLNYAHRREINITGVVVNNYPERTKNFAIKRMADIIKKRTYAEVLGVLPPFAAPLNPNDLIERTITGIDIEAALQMKIAKL